MEDEAERPLVLIVDHDPLERARAAVVLRGAGWRVAGAPDRVTAVALLQDLPALVLLDLLTDEGGAAAIREGGGPAGSTPILARAAAIPADLRARGFDGFVPRPCTPAELVEATRHWLPDEGAALHRLEASFGTEPIRSVTEEFRAMLADALARLDGGDVRTHAHQIAGIAGTLGFAATGRAWLRVSEGDDSMAEEARRLSRRAIATIDRRAK